MLKKVMYLIVCVLTLMQSVCSADTVYGGCVLGGSYAVSLTEQIVAQNLTGGSSSVRIYGTSDTNGMSFVVTKNCLLSSISVDVSAWGGTNANTTMRIGTSNDLSSVFGEESSSTTVNGTGEFTWSFDGTSSLATGTTYYFLIRNPDGAYGTNFRINQSSNSNVYTDGAQEAGDNWVSAGPSDNYDLVFTVRGMA